MKFTVVWKPAAEAELAEIWTLAADKRSIAAAANEIDVRLAIQPETLGESRSGAIRVWLVGPIGVTYEIIPDDRIVRVLDVWTVR
jgi:hypothetical protein